MRLGLLVLLVGCQPSGSSENRVIPVVTPTAPSYAADLNNVKGGAVSATIGIEPLPGEQLGYFIEPPPDGLLEPGLWRAEVAAALGEWSRAIEAGTGSGERGLEFVEVFSQAEAAVVIGFRDGDHEDGCDAGFSSVSTMAHAFTYRNGCLAGTIHLNSDLIWVLNAATRDEVFDVRSVILHEVGHLLGLDHIDDPSSIMNAAYEGPIRQVTPVEARLVHSAR